MQKMTDNEHYTARPGKFFGVYILYSNNQKQNGDVYIGFTVNPQRRIKQHNREIKGGAWKTGKNKGTWDMVLITHGFPTRLSALQFEWAWQNPQKSKRLSHIPRKSNKQSKFTYKLRILSEMLNTGPWHRLPLTIQWLKQEYVQQFPIDNPPPMHMPIAYGPIKTVKELISPRKESTKEETKEQEDNHHPESPAEEIIIDSQQAVCGICLKSNDGCKMEDKQQIFLHCIVESCSLVAHMKCLAELFLQQESSTASLAVGKRFLIPVSGRCLECNQEMMWGDILKQRKYMVDSNDCDDDSEDIADTQQDFEEDAYSQEDDEQMTQSQEF